MSGRLIFIISFTIVVTTLIAWGIFSLKKRNPELYKGRNTLVQVFGLVVDLFRTIF